MTAPISTPMPPHWVPIGLVHLQADSIRQVHAYAEQYATQQTARLEAKLEAMISSAKIFSEQDQSAEKEVAELRKLLVDAAEEIESWGAYAMPYFQEKHDLAGTVKRFKDAAIDLQLQGERA